MADIAAMTRVPAPARHAALQSLRNMVGTIISRGRDLRARLAARARPDRKGSAATLESLCRELLSRRGEASGVTLARAALDEYRVLDRSGRLEFFAALATRFGPDPSSLDRAWARYAEQRGAAELRDLLRAAEPPRQELFRRLNQAPGGTADIVAMRAALLAEAAPEFAALNDDLVHLLGSWFNRGFLVLEPVSWSSPADLLERIIRYEAVHMIQGWDDLRRRLQPPDRRCYAFFHPSLADEPLIFVEVALTCDIPASIKAILAEDRKIVEADRATTAVFYSISNCQAGLRGISFGNLLIKQVVEQLKRDLPQLERFVTLSPAPGFASWLRRSAGDAPSPSNAFERAALTWLESPNSPSGPEAIKRLNPVMTRLAAVYYLRAKDKSGLPLDPVARFHLGNGARLERINWPADLSPTGIAAGAGLMVNYLYDLASIEENHDAFWNSAVIAASPAVKRLLREGRSSNQG